MYSYWGHFDEILNTYLIDKIDYFVFEKKKCSIKLYNYVIENKKKYFFATTQNDIKKIALNNRVPELTIVASFGLIFPENVIKYLNNNIINIHPGILPEYRGRHPLPQAIINKDKFMGITSHFLTSSIDKGKIIESIKILIDYSRSYLDNLEVLKSFLPYIFESTIKRVRENRFPIILSEGKNNYYKPLSQELIKEIVELEKLIDLFN